MVLWLALGAPWLPAAAAAAAAVLAGRRVVPRRFRRPLLAATVVGGVVLAVEVSGWVWPLLAAGALVAVLPLAGLAGRNRGRVRMLLVVAGVLAVVGTASQASAAWPELGASSTERPRSIGSGGKDAAV